LPFFDVNKHLSDPIQTRFELARQSQIREMRRDEVKIEG
jgi:hypothetical protein